MSARSIVVLACVAIGSVAACAFDPDKHDQPALGSSEGSTGPGERPAVDTGSDEASGGPAGSSGSTMAGSTGETGDASTSDATTAGAACGNGDLDDGEECDDGNSDDADACSNACDAQFYTGTSEPCADFGQTLCGYFNAECRVDPDGPESRSLCYWPLAPDEGSCDETPGIWTADDSGFAVNSGFDYPPGGACITQIANLTCDPADAQTCTDAQGTLCFREMGPAGNDLDTHRICWWDVDLAGCDSTPGLWTTADSGFGQIHQNALPPDGQATCILQVTFI